MCYRPLNAKSPSVQHLKFWILLLLGSDSDTDFRIWRLACTYSALGSDFAWGFGPACGPPFVRKNAAFVFVSQPLGTNAYWNQKQADRLL
jgi:hypothetical protein